jgi:hypothetical protein
MGMCGLDSSGSEYGVVAGSCEHGNEVGKFPDYLRDYLLASKEGLCSVELLGI